MSTHYDAVIIGGEQPPQRPEVCQWSFCVVLTQQPRMGKGAPEMFAARDFGTVPFCKKVLYPTNGPHWGARTSVGGPVSPQGSNFPPIPTKRCAWGL